MSIISASDYDLLRYPVVTEKSSVSESGNLYVFIVMMSANKKDIVRAVEMVYGVSVLSVNTLILKGKTKNFRGKKGRRSNKKKAYVRLKEGYTIDLGIDGQWQDGRVGYGS